jgi:hypothetical protein
MLVISKQEKSGIYSWTLIYNGKSYLGSSSKKTKFSNSYNYNYIIDPKKNKKYVDQ